MLVGIADAIILAKPVHDPFESVGYGVCRSPRNLSSDDLDRGVDSCHNVVTLVPAVADILVRALSPRGCLRCRNRCLHGCRVEVHHCTSRVLAPVSATSVADSRVTDAPALLGHHCTAPFVWSAASGDPCARVGAFANLRPAADFATLGSSEPLDQRTAPLALWTGTPFSRAANALPDCDPTL
jgi:hypothetical protein